MTITTEGKIRHKKNLENLRREIGEIVVENRSLVSEIEDHNERSGEYDGYRTIALAVNYLGICDRYIRIDESSRANINKKSDNDLKEARSNFSYSIREIEIWAKQIEDYLVDKDVYMEKIKKFNAARLLQLMKLYKSNIDKLYEGFKKTRWWGNIVSLDGNALNQFLYLVNFKEISNPHYMKAFYDQKIQVRMRLLDWIKRVSNSYREKYMLQTRETSDTDIKSAIKFQDDLRRICSVIGEPDEVEQARKTISVWTSMKEKDSEDREKKRSKSR